MLARVPVRGAAGRVRQTGVQSWTLPAVYNFRVVLLPRRAHFVGCASANLLSLSIPLEMPFTYIRVQVIMSKYYRV